MTELVHPVVRSTRQERHTRRQIDTLASKSSTPNVYRPKIERTSSRQRNDRFRHVGVGKLHVALEASDSVSSNVLKLEFDSRQPMQAYAPQLAFRFVPADSERNQANRSESAGNLGFYDDSRTLDVAYNAMNPLTRVKIDALFEPPLNTLVHS